MKEPVERWRIVATGTVQLVSYRERVQRVAIAHRIVGTVENDKKDEERVLIDAQGPPANLKDFMKDIQGPEGRSDAHEVTKTKRLEHDPGLTRFIILRGKARQETLERMEFTKNALSGLTDEIESFRSEVKGELSTLVRSLEQLTGTLSTVSGSVEAVKDGEQAAQARLDQLETSYESLSKALATIEQALQNESKATEQRARSLEMQRAAILRLAGKLEKSATNEPPARDR